MKTRTVILWIFVLVATDQAIKIIINTHFVDEHFVLIPSLVEFKPTFNDKHSFANVLLNRYLNINVGLLPHLVLFLFIGTAISSYFFYLRNNINKGARIIDTSIIFLFAGIICALIGNLIWEKGTLDYVYLKPLFVFDLKDVYGDIGAILLLLYATMNYKQLRPVKSKDVFLYVKKRLVKNIGG